MPIIRMEAWILQWAPCRTRPGLWTSIHAPLQQPRSMGHAQPWPGLDQRLCLTSGLFWKPLLVQQPGVAVIPTEEYNCFKAFCWLVVVEVAEWACRCCGDHGEKKKRGSYVQSTFPYSTALSWACSYGKCILLRAFNKSISVCVVMFHISCCWWACVNLVWYLEFIIYL